MVEAARLQAVVEVVGAQQAAQQLQNFGTQINQSGQAAQRSATGHAAMGRSMQQAGTQAGAAGRGLDSAAKGASAAGQSAQRAATSMGGLGGVFGNVNAQSMIAAAGIAGVGVTAMNMGRQAIRTVLTTPAKAISKSTPVRMA